MQKARCPVSLWGSCNLDSNLSCPKLASWGDGGMMALAEMAGEPVFFNNTAEEENQAPSKVLGTPENRLLAPPQDAGGSICWEAKALL